MQVGARIFTCERHFVLACPNVCLRKHIFLLLVSHLENFSD